MGQRQGVCQQVVGTAVNGLGCYDVLARLRQCLEGIVNCCRAGSNCQSSYAAFQGSDTLFEYAFSRVRQSAVDIAGITKTETVSCMLRVMEHIGSGCVDRNSSCVRYRICLFLTNVKLSRLKTPVLRIFNICHCFIPP